MYAFRSDFCIFCCLHNFPRPLDIRVFTTQCTFSSIFWDISIAVVGRAWPLLPVIFYPGIKPSSPTPKPCEWVQCPSCVWWILGTAMAADNRTTRNSGHPCPAEKFTFAVLLIIIYWHIGFCENQLQNIIISLHNIFKEIALSLWFDRVGSQKWFLISES